MLEIGIAARPAEFMRVSAVMVKGEEVPGVDVVIFQP